ncbi:MAG TPA: glycosyltransferase [Paludibacteraceae bacterium]|nr:glycosyltransferase [Paludibacteraceae bacterium]HOL00395.1 glycosyltransferase [Paludibacteraceae bacterium]HPO67295.1 glycosyltransferase [Paludibacteraceae bacterium]
MQKTAIVCVTNDLTTDQRVHKTCLTLQKCGYQTIEVGRMLPQSLPLERPYSVHRFKLWFRKGPQFYAEYNIRLFFYLLFSKVDLIFANDLDTLPAAFLAAKIRRKRLIYDTHEYFTETPELVNRPRTKKIWEKIENFIFPKLTDIITVNQSIANLYESKYHKKIYVCRNIPLDFTPTRLKTREELGLPLDKHILILQGTGINVQRGAEEAVLTMQYLEDCVLLIIGSGDIIPELQKMIDQYQLQEKIIIKPKMLFQELRQYTMNSDLGLAIDKDTNLNYHYSLPNKLFDYIHAEIPILSSGLPEIKQIIDQYDIGYYIQNHHPKHIAEVIQNIFNNPQRYALVKQNTAKAKAELNWEKEEQILIELINKTF